MDQNDTSWVRAWLPSLLTAMVDAQFADPPASPAGDAPAPWTFASPYPFEAVAAESGACATRPLRFAPMALLRGVFAGRRAGPQHGV